MRVQLLFRLFHRMLWRCGPFPPVLEWQTWNRNTQIVKIGRKALESESFGMV